MNKETLAYVTALIIILLVSIFTWQFVRKIHYKFSYENMVRETVTEMVKPEYLK